MICILNFSNSDHNITFSQSNYDPYGTAGINFGTTDSSIMDNTGTTHVLNNNLKKTDFSVEVYPNPFKENITISYDLKKESDVNIEVYDLLGKKIANLVSTTQKEGKYNINLNAAKLEMNQSIYFVKLTIGKTTYLKRIVNSK